MVKSNRRKLLKAVSTGVAASSGFGLGSTSVAGSEGDGPDLTELDGERKNQLRAKAVKSPEFKTLKRYVKKTYDVRPSISDASAYKVENGNETRYGVEIPLPGIKDSIHSAIAVFVREGAVIGASGSTAKVDGEQVVRYTRFKAEDGAVTAESISLATEEDRRTILKDYGPSGPHLAGQCSDCEWAISRLCGWGCGISAATFCGLIGVAYPIAGIGCGSLFALYCYELDASGSCYYKGSAKADCEFMGYC
ncbi:hypothetical protein NGM10_03265 [Halorussus salilacus]|uniref:hypothetical protein n=1 Tax=Halorussus salilacus TaxID=2953750 RepID=UPI00209E1F80|nr:hypothetical protein [Halorussus salilacus]USZ68764.1 hypothetical protein NGM10_03265 [Halorussus salilacus]